MRPPRSFICAIICASTNAGLATAPPNDPECRSVLLPRRSIWTVDQAAQAVADRRHAALEHSRVGDHDHVGLQLVLVRADEVVEVRTADFLFALDHELHVHGQAAVLLHVRFDRLEVHEHLPLVVGRAARVDLAVANRRLEGRRLPQIQRIDRLHVVVPVEQDGGRLGRAEPVAIDDRIARASR